MEHWESLCFSKGYFIQRLSNLHPGRYLAMISSSLQRCSLSDYSVCLTSLHPVTAWGKGKYTHTSASGAPMRHFWTKVVCLAVSSSKLSVRGSTGVKQSIDTWRKKKHQNTLLLGRQSAQEKGDAKHSCTESHHDVCNVLKLVQLFTWWHSQQPCWSHTQGNDSSLNVFPSYHHHYSSWLWLAELSLKQHCLYHFTCLLTPYSLPYIWFPEGFFVYSMVFGLGQGFFDAIRHLYHEAVWGLQQHLFFHTVALLLLLCACRTTLLLSLPASSTMLSCILFSFVSTLDLNDFSCYNHCIQSLCAGNLCYPSDYSVNCANF